MYEIKGFWGVNGKLDPHVVRNYEAVQNILVESNKIQLVLQGHCHSGAISVQKGITFITLGAMVDECHQATIMLVTCKKHVITLQMLDASDEREPIIYELTAGSLIKVTNGG